MKTVPNKKHSPKYYPVEIYQVTITIDCDIGDGYTNGIRRTIPLNRIAGGNTCKYGADIDIGTVKISPKWFKTLRKRIY